MRKLASNLRKQGHNAIVIDSFSNFQKRFKFLCDILWKHQKITDEKNNVEKCYICDKIISSVNVKNL